ncbi:MAG: indolepyruvate ferredoxin oxidoreductase family protein [Steroidobacteraceae bacterium]|nr:indolepyruvate ferredoxin oxidoreductase family protein [Steroidobacteraceae bacterium]
MTKPDRDFQWRDVYLRERGRAYITGIQALVRLPMMQRRLDRARGLSTAGLVSGYRGSPLGGYDLQLWKAAELLKSHDVVFQPGLNEDLAATALWGAQMHRAFGAPTADGVFGIWYGKGPGVDRTGDVFRNANVQGASRLGGVVACVGDDHAAQSSMFPHQTDGICQSVSMPILQPASIAELLSLGLAGFALSRYSGLWVAMKTLTDVVESAGSIELPEPYPEFRVPEDFAVPPHGLNWDPRIRWPGQRAELERRLVEERLPAARAWAAANGIDRVIVRGAHARFGVVTVGKAHQDLMQALAELGLGTERLRELGISVYKVGMSWPLATQPALAFAAGLDEVLVVEEKRGIVEPQLKEAFYHLPADRRPRVSGKVDPDGRPLLPETLEFTPLTVARALHARFGAALGATAESLARWERVADDDVGAALVGRKPYFCAGCPHNTSLQTPGETTVGGGIGCHVMAVGEPELRTSTFSQMGGEGVQWVGAAPFVGTKHVFQNLGDGTYQHSGLLGIRAAVAARANVTFKILYNDAVAMTGGQAPDGTLDPLRVIAQLKAEGVKPIALVSDDTSRWHAAKHALDGVELLHRDELDALQRRYAGEPGVSAIVYEQICASEKRRRRKRGTLPEPTRRLFINPRVCEGCGDCSTQSRCIAVEPVDTEYGRKRQVNQSVCNKDYSCAKGFCPSFVEIDGAVLRKPDAASLVPIETALFAGLPKPSVPALAAPCQVYVAGVGGTGVLTLGALLGAAAHLEGLAATVLDYTGLAQKNGAVVSQVRLAPAGHDLHSPQIGAGATDLLLGADLVVAAAPESLRRLSAMHGAAVLNVDVTPTAHVVVDRDAHVPADELRRRVAARTAEGRCFELEAARLAEALFGDGVYANTLLLGYAWQRGLVPLSLEALERAIALNGAAVATNQRALHWGRAAAHDLATVLGQAGLGPKPDPAAALARLAPEALIERRATELDVYQDAAYARRYRDALAPLRGRVPDAWLRRGAEALFRLMAYKDEYEVARLYADPQFEAALAAQFAGRERVSVWLAPPLIGRVDPATGRARKRRFGPWVFTLFRVLARCKGLRGTRFDPFGWTEERRLERGLIADYAADLAALAARGDRVDPVAAEDLLGWPDSIRGFGVVKLAAVPEARRRRRDALARLDRPAERTLDRAA